MDKDTKKLTKEASQELEVKEYVTKVKVENNPSAEGPQKVFVLKNATVVWGD